MGFWIASVLSAVHYLGFLKKVWLRPVGLISARLIIYAVAMAELSFRSLSVGLLQSISLLFLGAALELCVRPTWFGSDTMTSWGQIQYICITSAGFLPINRRRIRGPNGSITVTPVYAGIKRPMKGRHKRTRRPAPGLKDCHLRNHKHADKELNVLDAIASRPAEPRTAKQATFCALLEEDRCTCTHRLHTHQHLPVENTSGLPYTELQRWVV
jgi:hypothetical protein